jgi:hypothetical protein
VAVTSDYQQQLRARFLNAPVMPAPAPWRPLPDPYYIPVGGLLGVGFAPHPVSGHDFVMVASHAGRGVFAASTGAKVARDRDSDPEFCMPSRPDLFHSDYSVLRAAGFSPSGRAVVIATSSDITLWHRGGAE